MAIQVRRGLLANYDKDKMLAGELAVTTDTESQNQQVFVAFAPGKSKRILTEDDNVVNTIQHIWTGVCDTHAGTETKIVTLDNPYGFALENGVTIAVYFTNPNRADVPKLNVNDTGAISVKFSTHITDYDMTEPYNRWGDGMKLFTYKDGAWMIAFGEKTDLAYTVLALSNKAPTVSPALTGTPTAPTAAAGTNTTQVATTAFVQNAVSGLASTLTATESDGVVTLSIS